MKSNSKLDRLPVRRIAVTVPPDGWFYGIARALFYLYRQSLVELGMEVFDIPVDAFLPPDVARIAQLTAELRAFRPDLAIGLPYGSYALICRLPARRDGWRPNLFTETLDVPTVCLWDHAPIELADQLLSPHPQNPAESSSGAIETLCRALTHPRLIHWSLDSGQTQIMRDLGFALPNRVVHEMAPTLPGFLPHETSAGFQHDARAGACFVGNFYQELPNHLNPTLGALAEETIQTWIGAGEQSLWDVLARRIATMEPDLRQKLALDRDQTHFWRFAHRLICHQAQTSMRLNLLGAAGVPVACYGNLRTDVGGVAANLRPVPGHIPLGPQLAELFARHPITIDVLNPGFVHGYGLKPVLAFSAGGFMLVNRKQDFVDAFGPAAEAASYRDGSELAAKVDLFLSKPKYRRDVGDEIRERIYARFRLNQVLLRVLFVAFQYVEGRHSNPTPPNPSGTGLQVTPVMDLLPNLRSEPYWPGAEVQHLESGELISTASDAWTYSAAIGIPPEVSAMNEPYLRMTLIVETGRIGIAVLLDETGVLVAEQVVSVGPLPITLTVELPRDQAVRVLLRNTIDKVSRALVLEASLCDRTPSERCTGTMWNCSAAP